jgi:hypothetical protein
MIQWATSSKDGSTGNVLQKPAPAQTEQNLVLCQVGSTVLVNAAVMSHRKTKQNKPWAIEMTLDKDKE